MVDDASSPAAAFLFINTDKRYNKFSQTHKEKEKKKTAFLTSD